MPKAKTHSGASQAVPATPEPARSCGRRPTAATCWSTSRARRTRRLEGRTTVAANDTKRVKKMLNG